jgi:hypothetical protein
VTNLMAARSARTLSPRFLPTGLISQKHPLRPAGPKTCSATRHRTPVRDNLYRLRLSKSVIHRPVEMVGNLCGLAGGNQRADRHESSIAGSKIRAKPEIAEQNIGGVLRVFRKRKSHHAAVI